MYDTRTFPIAHSKEPANFPYCVQFRPTENWSTSACFRTYQEAHAHIVERMDLWPRVEWRILIYRSKP